MRLRKLVMTMTLALGGGLVFFPLFGQQIDGGGLHSLMRCADGTVWASGVSLNNSLGTPGHYHAEVPLAVGGGFGSVVAISAGLRHGIALRADSTVWVWGLNNYGQLGIGTTIDGPSPVQIIGFGSIVAISAGADHSMALRADSTVWTWGHNSEGQLGLGDTLDESVPQQVPGLTDIVAIAAGGYFSMALHRDGHISAWGANSYGQVGDGTLAKRKSPVQVPNLDSVQSIAAGLEHALAIDSSGLAWAWGRNNHGQLGQGDFTDRASPAAIVDGDTAQALASGGWHTLLLRTTGTLWSCGKNDSGQLGLGDITDRKYFDQLDPLPGITSLAAGWNHSMAISANGTVWAWGANQFGQLGVGSLVNQLTPTPVIGLCPTATAVPDPIYTDYFRPSAGGLHRWIAGELASSIALPDGRTMWVFGKSHLDDLNPNNTIPCNRTEIDNCLQIQDTANVFTTYLDLTPGLPTRAFFHLPVPDTTTHLYPGHGYMKDADTAVIFLSRYADDSTFLESYAAKVGIVTMTVLDITRCIQSNNQIDFGNAVIVDSLNGQLYLYGSRKDSAGRYPYLVRRQLANDSATWYYATPAGWSPALADARPVSALEVSRNFSVTAIQGHYYMITHNPAPSLASCTQQRNVLAYRSDSLKGPFGEATFLATPSDTIAGLPVFGFNAYAHAAHTHCDTLLLSYNVRDIETDGNCTSQCAAGNSQHADTWRPQFMRVPFELVDTALSTATVANFTVTQNGNTYTFVNTSQFATQYHWNFGDGHTSTATDTVHTYANSGTYTVTLTVWGCGGMDVATFPIVHVHAEDAVDSPSLTLFPNPNTGRFHLQAENLAPGPLRLEVLDLMGQKVWGETQVTVGGRLDMDIDLTLSAGIYFLRIDGRKGTAVRKLVVNGR